MKIDPGDVELVFECEDCQRKKKVIMSTVIYNGAPLCCSVPMMISHAEITK